MFRIKRSRSIFTRTVTRIISRLPVNSINACLVSEGSIYMNHSKFARSGRPKFSADLLLTTLSLSFSLSLSLSDVPSLLTAKNYITVFRISCIISLVVQTMTLHIIRSSLISQVSRRRVNRVFEQTGTIDVTGKKQSMLFLLSIVCRGSSSKSACCNEYLEIVTFLDIRSTRTIGTPIS